MRPMARPVRRTTCSSAVPGRGPDMKRGLFQRAREERLPQVAGSLTFTTVLSVVPLLAVSFALFMRFPMLKRLQEAIHEHLLKGLLPAEISRPVLRHLDQFAANTSGLTLVGSLFLVASAVLLLLTVENAFNRIWAVKKNRPLARRVGLYLLMLALGPLVLGASLWATSSLLSASMGLVKTMPPPAALLLNAGPALLGALGFAGLFYFVPNTPVRRRDAILGGLLAGIAFE